MMSQWMLKKQESIEKRIRYVESTPYVSVKEKMALIQLWKISSTAKEPFPAVLN